jgi:hypothetical protein
MTEVNDIVDTLVKKAKSVNNIEGVKFIRAYNQGMTERPFQGFTCVVNIESVSQPEKFLGGYYGESIKGELYSVKLCLRVYADNETSGEDLGATTLNISQAFISADENKIIASSYIGPITYDNQLQSIYREINISLEFCLCGEV